ncbi:MAG: class I SAM-dependent methyltransferase [Polyangia bacterium]
MRALRTGPARELWATGLLVAVAVTVAVWVAPGCRRERPQPSRPPPGPGSAFESFRRPAVLVAALGLPAGAIVAEIGAGSGLVTLPLARAVGPTGRVVATDLDEAALAALRERADADGLRNITTRRVDPAERDRPGLEAATYDLVLLAHVDHLLADRGAYLRSLRPVLRRGGRIAVSNRQDRQPGLREAAAGAGLSVREVAVDLPGQFLWELRPGAAP